MKEKQFVCNNWHKVCQRNTEELCLYSLMIFLFQWLSLLEVKANVHRSNFVSHHIKFVCSCNRIRMVKKKWTGIYRHILFVLEFKAQCALHCHNLVQTKTKSPVVVLLLVKKNHKRQCSLIYFSKRRFK